MAGWGDWISTGLNAVKGVYDAYQGSRANDRTADFAREANRQAYDNYNVNRDAYLEYLKYAQGIQDQNAAGASAASRAAAAARSRVAAAMASARMKEDKAKQRAARKGMDYLNNSMDEARGMLLPFYEAGMEVLPEQVAAYRGGISNLRGAQEYFAQNSPWEQPRTPDAQDIPLASMRKFMVNVRR